jgi:S-adenosylmethionine hydrolase
VITLTTDFGYRDPFVGIMKGVILSINPAARIVDLSHDIAPQDITAAAWVLRHSIDYFPKETIHIAVVDPGVGSSRRALLIQYQDHYLLGPDNGVLSLALQEKPPVCSVNLSNQAYHRQPTSATFHGRDIFAPVAAYLSLGVPALNFGERVEEFVRLPFPKPRKSAGTIEGEIIYIDRFGNLFTNIHEADLAGLPRNRLTVLVGAISIGGLAGHYDRASEGDFVALINSSGVLEIAAYKDNAQRRTQAAVGEKVQVKIP